MPFGLGDSVAVSLFVCGSVGVVQVGAGLVQVDGAAAKEIVAVLGYQVNILVPQIHNDRRRSFESVHVVNHLQSLEIDRVQAILDNARFNFLIVIGVPKLNEGIGSAIGISSRDISALKDETPDFARLLQSLGRRFCPGCMLLEVDGAALLAVVDGHLKLDHASFVVIFDRANRLV